MPRLVLVPGWLVPRSYAAWVPLPGLILWDRNRRVSRVTLAHELAHVKQWERHGLTFPFRYLWQLRLPHDKRPLEIEARNLSTSSKYLVMAEDLMRSKGLNA